MRRNWIQLAFAVALGLLATRQAGAQCELQRLIANDGRIEDRYAFSLAMNDQQLLVGVPFHDDAFYTSRGAVYVYSRTGLDWLLCQVILADPTTGAGLGRPIAIHEDAALIGRAPWPLVFQFDGQSWNRTGILLTDVGPYSEFGDALALTEGIALVGAPFARANGAVFVFGNDGPEWVVRQVLEPVSAPTGDTFGSALDIDPHGEVIAIGAPNSDEIAFSSGSVFIYERDEENRWREVGRFIPDPPGFGAILGNSIAVLDDIVFAGAPQDDSSGESTGAVYVYERGTDAVWRRVQKLLASDGEAGESFGWTVQLRGNTALIGARRDNIGSRNQVGSVYVFRRQADGSWLETQKLTASDGRRLDEFGSSLAMSDNFAAIGAPFDNNENGRDAGAAYVFALGPDDNNDGVPDPCECPADLDGDGQVLIGDLEILLENFGTAGSALREDGDLDEDGDINLNDLALLLSDFGMTCP